jgi:pimeloyl-ACP methyl ester carboxylesterase
MHLILVNGVYGAPEHFDALRAALARDVTSEVFTFGRLGEPDPRPEHAFDPMVRRLDPLVRALSAKAADLPASQDAAAPQPQQPQRPALLGFSLGGALALEYALQHGDRLAALVLVNAFDRYYLGGGLQPGALPPVWRVPVRFRHQSFMSRLVHRLSWLRRGLFHDRATLDDVDRGMLSATSVSMDDVRFQLAHIGLPLPRGQSDRLARLAERMPVLLIASRDDMVVAPYHTERLARIMPAARRLPPFDGGHAFFQHDGAELAAAVRSFLAEVQTSPDRGIR